MTQTPVGASRQHSSEILKVIRFVCIKKPAMEWVRLSIYFVLIVPLYGRDYTGYGLYSIIPETEEQLEFVRLLEANGDSDGVQFWRPPSFCNRSAQALVAPSFRRRFLRRMDTAGLLTTLDINDLESAIADQDRKQTYGLRRRQSDKTQSRTDQNGFDLFTFHSIDDIYAYLDGLSRTADYMDFLQSGSIGSSFEGRPLKYVKIGYHADTPKKALFIDAGIHAREWITHAVALTIIDALVNRLEYRALLKEIDVYVLPCVNPDGYEYTRKKNRLWRKTRSGPNGIRRMCYGADVNRNFPMHWGSAGATLDPCDEQLYCGLYPLSEPEAKALAEFLKENRQTISAYVTLHSYGNYIIYPFGYSAGTYPDDIDDLRNVANKITTAIRQSTNETYRSGTAHELVNYLASGASDDYAKYIGIKYAYTFELTDTAYGFIVPARYIAKTARSALSGIEVVAETVRQMK